MFNGFTMEASQFFWELMFHNERPWFEEHKDDFVRLLKDPFDALAEETRQEMEKLCPGREFNIHVSRIYRDARRLFGRGPYKDHLWFSLYEGDRRSVCASFWFEVGPSTYSWGTGFWSERSDTAEAWRRYVDADPAAVERLARRYKRQKEFQLEGPLYKRLKGHEGEILEEWYNRKWLGLLREEDFGGALLSADFPKTLAESYQRLMPYYDMFARFRMTGGEETK